MQNTKQPKATMDEDQIAKLIGNGSSAKGIAKAQAEAKKAWPPFPHNGCAANLSALLRQSGIKVDMTLGAGKLAHILRDDREWSKIEIGDQNAGDVGVTYDEGGNPGADHIYLCVQRIDNDEMMISDNQATTPHHRFASGNGKTPTEYFLRAVNV
jgi:hypothetical protein